MTDPAARAKVVVRLSPSQSGFGWGVFEKIKTATAAAAVFHIVVISTGTKHDCDIS